MSLKLLKQVDETKTTDDYMALVGLKFTAFMKVSYFLNNPQFVIEDVLVNEPIAELMDAPQAPQASQAPQVQQIPQDESKTPAEPIETVVKVKPSRKRVAQTSFVSTRAARSASKQRK